MDTVNDTETRLGKVCDWVGLEIKSYDDKQGVGVQ